MRQGINASILPDDGIQIDAPDQSPEQLRAAAAKCAPAEGGEPAALTDKDYEALYLNAKQQIECLRGQGYEVDGLPTLETFRETWKAGKPWTPYERLSQLYSGLANDELQALNVACPQFVG